MAQMITLVRGNSSLEDVGSVYGVDGVVYPIDAQGLVTVPTNCAPTLIARGYTVMDV